MKKAVKKIVILGSTGSIGQQTLDIVRSFPDELHILGLACGENVSLFNDHVNEFNPALLYSSNYQAGSGKGKYCSLEDMVSHPDADLILIATTGKAGLLPTVTAVKAGKTVALANKEILVMAGPIITSLIKKHRAQILPVDSEHSAIWQCLRGEDKHVERLILTASGGPFYGTPRERQLEVQPLDALNHPTWKMGKKVTIDSATLFNKGLEVIEAHWLFNIPYEKIEIVIHRQSIIHSMIEFADGSIKAQLSVPDMRLPIQYALFYPKRVNNADLPRMSFDKPLEMTFAAVDYAAFPCLKLAIEAGKRGGTYPAVLCAADEIAVELFLQSCLRFADIERIIERTLSEHDSIMNPSLEEIILIDGWARATALEFARKETTCY